MVHNISQPAVNKTRISKLFLCICLAILSVYPIYRNFYYSNGLTTYERHRAVIENRSTFYNPWQYRILCPYTIEAILWVYNHTVDKVYPIEDKMHFSIEHTSETTAETDQFITLMQTPGAIKYMIIFVLFRFTEHLLIFYLAWKLWRYFIKSKWLIFFGLNFLALALGNAVAVADLAFNTYMDVTFYLIAANIIVYKKNPLYIIPLAILASFNRETGIIIPALYFISQVDFTRFSLRKFDVKNIGFPKLNTWIITAIAYVGFFIVFIGIRMHYGYQPQQDWKVPAGLPMLKLNLFSAVGIKGYLELIGTFAVLPLMILYRFKRMPPMLRQWFIFLVPVWFLAHYVTVTAYQTRLFLVPIVVIMLPMILWSIQNDVQSTQEKTVI